MYRLLIAILVLCPLLLSQQDAETSGLILSKSETAGNVQSRTQQDCNARGQLWEWDSERQEYHCVDDPRNSPNELNIDLRMRIRSAQVEFQSLRADTLKAHSIMLQSTLGIEYLQKEAELRKKAIYLSDLEEAARKECSRNKGMAYTEKSAQCEVVKMPLPEGVHP